MTAVATTRPQAGAAVKVRDVNAILEKHRAELSAFLTEGTTIEQVLGNVKFAVYNNPAIAECTPASLFECVAKIIGWGAEIGREAYIVPFNTKVKYKDESGKDCERWESKATAIADYKWLADLVVQVGGARGVTASMVYEGCLFEYEEGTKPYVRHVPWSIRKQPQGAIRGVYAVAFIGFGQTIQTWIDGAELEALRQKHSKQWKFGTMPEWWGEKTALRRLIKTLPKNTKLAKQFAKLQQIATDEDEAEALAAAPSAPALKAGSSPTSPTETAFRCAEERYQELQRVPNKSDDEHEEVRCLLMDFPQLELDSAGVPVGRGD